VPEPRNDRRAARAAGQRRVQTVTTWTAAGSVVAAGLLTAVLAHGTSAAATPTDQNTPNTGQLGNSDNNGGISGNDQLQAPQYLPGISGGSRHGGSGGS
jgi:hypothetical protein